MMVMRGANSPPFPGYDERGGIRPSLKTIFHYWALSFYKKKPIVLILVAIISF